MFYLQDPLLDSSATFPAFISVSMQDSSELLSRPQNSSGNLKKTTDKDMYLVLIASLEIHTTHISVCVHTSC